MYWSVYNCMYLPLVQFILGGRHEALEKGYQSPGVAWKQLVPHTLLHCLLVFDTANKLVVFIQQLVALSIQLFHHLCHLAVLALSAMSIRQLTVRTPARGTRSRGAEAVDGYLSTIHAERIEISSATSYLYIQVQTQFILLQT